MRTGEAGKHAPSRPVPKVTLIGIFRPPISADIDGGRPNVISTPPNFSLLMMNPKASLYLFCFTGSFFLVYDLAW